MTDVTLTTTPSPPPAPGSGDYPLSTLCLRLDVDGVSLSWTLRGDDSDVAARLPRVLEYIKLMQQKLRQPEAPPAATPPPPLEEREDWCEIHGVAMRKQSNDRGSWYSHRLPEGGYCKGRRRIAGA